MTAAVIVKPVRAGARSFEVICSDGHRRHAKPFATATAAREFAEWGHCCTAWHDIRPVRKTVSRRNAR